MPDEEASSAASRAGRADDSLYLCNFRVSVDGDWLCLRELEDLGVAVSLAESSSADAASSSAAATSPEPEPLISYPNYPLKQGKGMDRKRALRRRD